MTIPHDYWWNRHCTTNLLVVQCLFHYKSWKSKQAAPIITFPRFALCLQHKCIGGIGAPVLLKGDYHFSSTSLINRLKTNYCIGRERAENEIELFQDGSQLNREKDIYRYSPRPISITCHLPDPPCFSCTHFFKRFNYLLLNVTKLIFTQKI